MNSLISKFKNFSFYSNHSNDKKQYKIIIKKNNSEEIYYANSSEQINKLYYFLINQLNKITDYCDEKIKVILETDSGEYYFITHKKILA